MKRIIQILLFLPLACIGQTYNCEFTNTDTKLIEEKSTITIGEEWLVIAKEKDTLRINSRDIMVAQQGKIIVIYDSSGGTYMYRGCKRVMEEYYTEPKDTIKQ